MAIVGNFCAMHAVHQLCQHDVCLVSELNTLPRLEQNRHPETALVFLEYFAMVLSKSKSLWLAQQVQISAANLTCSEANGLVFFIWKSTPARQPLHKPISVKIPRMVIF
jgi:hypothetical protein